MRNTDVIENACLEQIFADKNRLVDWYLMGSYAYYCRNETLISDTAFDMIWQKLEAEWDNVQHRHKHLIDKESIQSPHHLKDEDYPLVLRLNVCGALGLDLLGE